MNKIFITILLTLLLLPAGINASESKTYPSYQVSTPITPTIKPIAVQPTTSPKNTQKVETFPGGVRVVGDPEHVTTQIISIPAQTVNPTIIKTVPSVNQQQNPCIETIIKETKEVVVLPKGM